MQTSGGGPGEHPEEGPDAGTNSRTDGTADGDRYVTGELVFAPAGADPDAGEVSVIPPARREEIAGAWLLSVRSPRTREAYSGDVRQWFAWADEFGIDALRPARFHADGYREYLTGGRFPRRGGTLAPYADSTIARKLTAVSSFLRYGAKHHPRDVPGNPMADVDRPQVDDESTSTGLDLAAAAQFLAAADRIGPREHALAQLFLGTGLRVSGIANAAPGDLGTERGTMTLAVRIKGNKKVRIPVPPEAAAALTTYLDGRPTGRTGPLFQYRAAWPSRQVIAHAIARIGREAGLGKLGLTPHDLRHTFTTLALDAGEDLRHVQDSLRHQNPRSTQRYDRGRHRLDRGAGRTVSAALHRARTTGHDPAGPQPPSPAPTGSTDEPT